VDKRESDGSRPYEEGGEAMRAWISGLTLLVFLVATPLFAQKKTLAQLTDEYSADLAVGLGTYVVDGQEGFQPDRIFLSAEAYGYSIPGVTSAMDISTGSRVEVGKPMADTDFSDIGVRVFSSTTVRIGRVITGTDVKLVDTRGWNFDVLMRVGYVLSKNIDFTTFLFEDNTLVSVVMNYRFDYPTPRSVARARRSDK
jgi:hypothetical protein